VGYLLERGIPGEKARKLESAMSRLNTPGVIRTQPTNNVYTGLAFISMASTLAALIFVVMRFVSLGLFK
jgi:hypothetical protein